MSKTPIAFLSYVRTDDQHENGRLTQFRERLSGEVRMQTGEAFEIFQDRSDIKWGQQWRERIEGTIDNTTFLIPVITPSFFKSEACRSELERFLKREEKLGRKDLILPVYYVECPVLSVEAKRKKDPLAMAVAERQWADWRELRFEPLTTPEVGKRLAGIASQIVEALGREDSTAAQTRSEPSAAERPSVPKGEGERAKEAGTSETSAAAGGPQPKTEVPTLIVDAWGRGDFATLTQALGAAKPGTRILVRPGLYQEGVVIDKPVEIIGDGERADIVIEATGKDVVLFQSSMGRIANLTLRQLGGGEWYGVDISQGRLDLEDCDISSESLTCVGIHDGAAPQLLRNRIHDGKSSGVGIYANGRGTLEDNEIFGNAHAGVTIRGGCNPTLRRNRIHDGKAGGVFVHTSGRGVLEDNEIFGNARAGVAISEGGNPTLRRNRIHDGKQGGVFVHTNGQGTLEDNEIFGNAFAGVEIKEGGNPTLRRNRICDGKQGGVRVHTNGQGVLEDNEIFGNAFAGVAIEEGGSPTLRRNRIHDNGYEGIWIRKGGGGVYEANDLRGNARGAWDIEPSALPNIQREGNIE